MGQESGTIFKVNSEGSNLNKKCTHTDFEENKDTMYCQQGHMPGGFFVFVLDLIKKYYSLIYTQASEEIHVF